jgi:hypothetical protein
MKKEIRRMLQQIIIRELGRRCAKNPRYSLRALARAAD